MQPFPVTGPSPLSGRTAICWWWTSPPGDRPRLQLPAGYPYRGGSPGLCPGNGVHLSSRQPAGQRHHRLRVIAKSGYVHDLLRRAFIRTASGGNIWRYAWAHRPTTPALLTPPSAGTRLPQSGGASAGRFPWQSPITGYWEPVTASLWWPSAGDRPDPSAAGPYGLHRLPAGRRLALRNRGSHSHCPSCPALSPLNFDPSHHRRCPKPDSSSAGGPHPVISRPCVAAGGEAPRLTLSRRQSRHGVPYCLQAQYKSPCSKPAELPGTGGFFTIDSALFFCRRLPCPHSFQVTRRGTSPHPAEGDARQAGPCGKSAGA